MGKAGRDVLMCSQRGGGRPWWLDQTGAHSGGQIQEMGRRSNEPDVLAFGLGGGTESTGAGFCWRAPGRVSGCHVLGWGGFRRHDSSVPACSRLSINVSKAALPGKAHGQSPSEPNPCPSSAAQWLCARGQRHLSLLVCQMDAAIPA